MVPRFAGVHPAPSRLRGTGIGPLAGIAPMQEKECPMTTHPAGASVTRRTALAGLGAGSGVQEFATAGSPPVIGNRIAVGQPNFPPGTLAPATPETGTPTT